MEWDLLLLTLLIELAWRDCEYEVSVLLVVDDLQGEATEAEVLLLRVLAAVLLPLLGNCARCLVLVVQLFVRGHLVHGLEDVLLVVLCVHIARAKKLVSVDVILHIASSLAISPFISASSSSWYSSSSVLQYSPSLFSSSSSSSSYRLLFYNIYSLSFY